MNGLPKIFTLPPSEQQTRRDGKQRGLPSPVGAEQAEHLARFDGE